MSSLLLIIIKPLVFTRPQDWEQFRLTLQSAWSSFLDLFDAEARSYLLLSTRPLWVVALIYSTLPWHIFPSIIFGILYYLWAFTRALTFALLLLSTCNFNPDRISHLPTELLNQIFQDASADLLSLSKVSKRFHAITQPELYRVIRLVKEPRLFHSHPLLLFMRTIENRSDLAEKVNSLELSSYQMGFESGDHRCLLTIFPGKEEVAVANRCADYVLSAPLLSSRSAWSQELKAGTLDAFTHLLLVWLPNLNSVSLQGYTWNKVNFLSLISQSVRMKAMFTQLKRLDLRCKLDVHDRRATKFSIRQFQQVLRIPSLRSLAVDMIESERNLWPLTDVDPSSRSALTSLDIALLHEENLGKILHLVPRLQKLKWTFWLNYKRPLAPNNMLCDKLQMSLYRCSNTLKEIRIIPEHGFGRQWRVNKVTLQGTMNLVAFYYLRTLEIPFNMLLGKQEEDGVVLANVLPKCLHHLILVDNPKTKHNTGKWGAISLLNVLRPFLVDIIHGKGFVSRELKTLTSRIYIKPQGGQVILREESSLWRKRLHAELTVVCELVGVEFIGD